MAKEIERKFLLKNNAWREKSDAGVRIKQGYLAGTDKASIRIRIEDDKANINIKSATLDIVRDEYEYSIPLEDARKILTTMCYQPFIVKTRYHVAEGDLTWEIDVFEGENAGLVVAEIELSDKHQSIPKPDWLGNEVSDDARYYNVNLVKHPYCKW